MENILQIIIPAYNSRDTIDKTLSSIAVQRTDYKYKVVIVNDNSDYNYSQYVERYSKYFDLDEIILDKNVGPALARQIGIEKTKSKYIMFIDSDDYLFSSVSLNDLVYTIITEDLDFVISDFIYQRENKIRVESKNLKFLHGKIYKRSFIEKNNITFNDIRDNEDSTFNKLVLFLDPRAKFLHKPTYVFEENQNMAKKRTDKAYQYNILKDYADNYLLTFSKAKERKVDLNRISDEAVGVIVSSYYYYLQLYDDFDVSKIPSWFREIYNQYYPKHGKPKNLESLLYIQDMLFGSDNKPLSFDDFLKKLEEQDD